MSNLAERTPLFAWNYSNPLLQKGQTMFGRQRTGQLGIPLPSGRRPSESGHRPIVIARPDQINTKTVHRIFYSFCNRANIQPKETGRTVFQRILSTAWRHRITIVCPRNKLQNTVSFERGRGRGRTATTGGRRWGSRRPSWHRTPSLPG